MKVLLNGEAINDMEAVISVFDHGFLYGMGLFETFRTYNGNPWLLELHAARLAESCRQLGINYKPDLERMQAGISRLLEENGFADAYIRWSVSAGEGIVGLPPGPYEGAAEIVYAKALAPDHPDTRAAKRLRLLRLRRSEPENGAARLKSFHYMNNIVAKRELAAGGADPSTEGLFLNQAGFVCEGIVSNVFWLADGVLYTPSLACGPLPGITRSYVMEMAASCGIRVQEGAFQFEDLAQADAAFLTNSVQEIVPIEGLEEASGMMVHRYEEHAARSLVRHWMSTYRVRAEGGRPE